MSSTQPPYARLSTFYFFYFAALGAFVPFWPVFLKSEIGFSATQIGQLMAVFMTSKIIAPLVWGWLVDHYGKRLSVIRWASFLTIICFAGVFIKQDFWWLATVVFLFGFFWNASLPQFEALTLNHLQGNIHKYSSIRLWGSIGFIIMVAGLPLILDIIGFSWLIHIILLLFISITLSSFLVNDKDHAHHAFEQGHISHVLKQPIVLALLFACMLQQASHGAYYTFFSIYLTQHNYSHAFIGWMWAVGVIAEVILFLLIQPLLQRFGAYLLFSLSVLITAIRWVLLAYFVDVEAVLWFSQILHAASYGLFHASAIQIIHLYFPGKLQGRGQALYAGLSFGVGGAIGSLTSGYAWDSIGAVDTFLTAALVAGIGWLVSLLLLSGSRLGNLGKSHNAQP